MKHITYIVRILTLCLLFGVYSAQAQSPCKASFQFTRAAAAKVAINAGAGHNIAELYDANYGFTWEAWVYLDDTDYDQVALIAVEDGVVCQDIFVGLGWNGPGSNSQLTFIVRDNTWCGGPQLNSTPRLNPGQWYYITAVCDYAGNTLSLYLDGTLIASLTSSFPPSLRLTRNITTSLGNFNSGSGGSFDGKIDEVKFWQGIRSASDILTDSAGCGPTPPGLLAYFKANEATGSATASSVSTNFSGTNTASWGPNAPVSICGTIATATIITGSVVKCDTATDSVTITVSVTGLPPGASWSVTLSDGSVISGTADGSGNGTGSVNVLPSVATTYTITSIAGYTCADLSGSMSITFINCCPTATITSAPVVKCDTATDSVAITVNVTGLPPGASWSVTLSDGSVISGTADGSGNGTGSVNVLPSIATSYTITSMAGYDCATLVGSTSVTFVSCCTCDMSLSKYSSTTNCNAGMINGLFHLNAGSKKVSSIEVSIPYFNFDVNASGCQFDCKSLMTGYALGNFVNPYPVAGAAPEFAGCFGEPFAREVDWHYLPGVNVDEDIPFTISIPKTQCHMDYDYCIKVIVHYSDCSMCECTICFRNDMVMCSCDGPKMKTLPAHKTTTLNSDNINIFPNPNGGQFTVTMDQTTEDKQITVMDMSGRIVTKSTVNGDVAKFDISNVAAGVYNVVITGSGNVVTKRVVISK